MSDPATQEACSICTEDFADTAYIPTVVTDCRHVFHYRCIKQWRERGELTCPNCRRYPSILAHPLRGVPKKDEEGISIPAPPSAECQAPPGGLYSDVVDDIGPVGVVLFVMVGLFGSLLLGNVLARTMHEYKWKDLDFSTNDSSNWVSQTVYQERIVSSNCAFIGSGSCNSFPAGDGPAIHAGRVNAINTVDETRTV